MRRLVLLLSLSLMTFGLAACGEEDDPPIGPGYGGGGGTNNNRPRIDAMPGAPDAMPSAPDAMPGT